MNHSAQHLLDHPVWNALNTQHKHLRQGGPLACRYRPDLAPFAAIAADTPPAYQALQQLLQPGEQAALLAFDPIESIDSLLVAPVGTLHQMVAAQHPAAGASGASVTRLSQVDVEDMLGLVSTTQPGPFSRRTLEMGHYIGIRDHGQLVAMAGERMRVDGYVEISAVCVHEAHRGKGLAEQLVTILRQDIERRGDTPFLHVLSGNHAAIRLYERLGFELRQIFHLARIKRADSVT